MSAAQNLPKRWEINESVGATPMRRPYHHTIPHASLYSELRARQRSDRLRRDRRRFWLLCLVLLFCGWRGLVAFRAFLALW